VSERERARLERYASISRGSGHLGRFSGMNVTVAASTQVDRLSSGDAKCSLTNRFAFAFAEQSGPLNAAIAGRGRETRKVPP